LSGDVVFVQYYGGKKFALMCARLHGQDAMEGA
jgi:hypothetical protein